MRSTDTWCPPIRFASSCAPSGHGRRPSCRAGRRTTSRQDRGGPQMGCREMRTQACGSSGLGAHRATGARAVVGRDGTAGPRRRARSWARIRPRPRRTSLDLGGLRSAGLGRRRRSRPARRDPRPPVGPPGCPGRTRRGHGSSCWGHPRIGWGDTGVVVDRGSSRERGRPGGPAGARSDRERRSTGPDRRRRRCRGRGGVAGGSWRAGRRRGRCADRSRFGDRRAARSTGGPALGDGRRWPRRPSADRAHGRRHRSPAGADRPPGNAAGSHLRGDRLSPESRPLRPRPDRPARPRSTRADGRLPAVRTPRPLGPGPGPPLPLPGCRRRVPRGGELDHSRPYPSGPTSAENLAGYCTAHHRGKHQAPGWRHALAPDGTLTVTTPTGLTAVTTPAPY